MRSYPVKENPMGSAVSEILRYKHANILLLQYKDFIRSIRKLYPSKNVSMSIVHPVLEKFFYTKFIKLSN